ncbi:MAG: hypothetical protein KDE04_14065 [Anaerolineales bacterium]|nr:hypothetical protein [Anaerolineales bacterium]
MSCRAATFPFLKLWGLVTINGPQSKDVSATVKGCQGFIKIGRKTFNSNGNGSRLYFIMWYLLPLVFLVLLVFAIQINDVDGGWREIVTPEEFIRSSLKRDGATAIDISAPFLSDGRGYEVYPVEFLAATGEWRVCQVYMPLRDVWDRQVIWDYDGDPFNRLDFELSGDADFVAQQTELAHEIKLLRTKGLL